MNCFDTSYRYDKHGNITFLGRYGQTGIDTYEIIDSLYMVYNGNQLEAVEDMATASVYNNGFEFRNGVSSEVEYFYDANGNLTKDLNKNILDMAEYLSETGKPVWIRHVLVPERSDKDEYLHRLHDFIETLDNVEKVEVLPYHTLGVYKWKELGIPYQLEGIDPPSQERVENANRILETAKYHA